MKINGIIEMKMEYFINKTRPERSERKPNTINPQINEMVERDMDKLAVEIDIENSSVNIGSSG